MTGKSTLLKNHSDQELLDLILKEDEDAWGVLYARYHDAIFRFCGNYVRGAAEAEDLAHDSFIKLREKAHTFKKGARLRPWLYQIARNTCLDYLRKQKHRKPSGSSDWSKCYFAQTSRIDIIDFTPSPASKIAQRDLHSRIMEELDGLSEEHRTVFLLKYVEGLSRDEISSTLEIPLGTVKSRLYHGMKKIREKLDRIDFGKT